MLTKFIKEKLFSKRVKKKVNVEQAARPVSKSETT
jgi:hypothetical protein